jgi:hypothetical protein
LTVTSLTPDLPLVHDDSVTLTIGQQISLRAFGIDPDQMPDKDFLRLELLKAEGNVTPRGYVFAPAEGRGTVQSVFSWNPDCSIFENGLYTNRYTFTFRLYDDRCYNVKGNTVTVHITIKDVDGSDTNFLPPNIITPNGDQINDYFAMVRRDFETGELVSILPLDNCQGRFLNIRVFNRWGREVFESENRDFKWTAPGEAAGVYFYYLNYTNKEYKGTITVNY